MTQPEKSSQLILDSTKNVRYAKIDCLYCVHWLGHLYHYSWGQAMVHSNGHNFYTYLLAELVVKLLSLSQSLY